MQRASSVETNAKLDEYVDEEHWQNKEERAPCQGLRATNRPQTLCPDCKTTTFNPDCFAPTA